MFRIRRAKVEDVATLLKLARMVHFINLPPDREIITHKVVHSRNGFLRVADRRARPEPEPIPAAVAEIGRRLDENSDGKVLAGYGTSTIESDLFMFVLEDLESGGVLGTSQTVTRMGGPGNPNVSLKLEERSFFSKSLQTGTSHTVATMHLDESGPTEIGGLILQPSYRGHKLKLGRFLSLVRFHFMGLHRRRFADRVLAEMMAAITPEGESVLWDYLGRRFVPLSYEEADRFCQYSREFITSLLPREGIYLSLLPPVARASIAEVGKETIPARKMLEKLGFTYSGQIDPFDGGPYLDCETDEIAPVKSTCRVELAKAAAASRLKGRAIVSLLHDDGEFYAIDEACAFDNQGRLLISEQSAELLKADAGATVGYTPYRPDSPEPPASARRKPAAKRERKKTTKKAAKKAAKRSA
ncbi:MAG: arginine N-succinyltransferase [Planctomycetota bacterium]